ncbi:MAG: OsmC family protein [Candidatus Omnitrophica bacterium]|nr:OsmC family protein [Candidatus Omnitrophota bacterium]
MGSIRQKSRKFIYKTNVSWIEERKGILCSSGKPTIEVSTPPEFKGQEGMWTPEELFVASVNTCIKLTFIHYAQRDNLEFLSYESEAEGILEIVEGKFMFSELKVRPKIKVSSSDQIEKAKRIMDLSEKNCLITNSIKPKVEVTAVIST